MRGTALAKGRTFANSESNGPSAYSDRKEDTMSYSLSPTPLEGLHSVHACCTPSIRIEEIAFPTEGGMSRLYPSTLLSISRAGRNFFRKAQRGNLPWSRISRVLKLMFELMVSALGANDTALLAQRIPTLFAAQRGL